MSDGWRVNKYGIACGRKRIKERTGIIRHSDGRNIEEQSGRWVMERGLSGLWADVSE